MICASDGQLGRMCVSPVVSLLFFPPVFQLDVVVSDDCVSKPLNCFLIQNCSVTSFFINRLITSFISSSVAVFFFNLWAAFSFMTTHFY